MLLVSYLLRTTSACVPVWLNSLALILPLHFLHIKIMLVSMLANPLLWQKPIGKTSGQQLKTFGCSLQRPLEHKESSLQQDFKAYECRLERTYHLQPPEADYDDDILRRELFIFDSNWGKVGYFLKYKQDLTKRLSETFPLSKCLAKSEGEEMVGELTTFQNSS